jgi:hypothetical protein
MASPAPGIVMNGDADHLLREVVADRPALHGRTQRSHRKTRRDIRDAARFKVTAKPLALERQKAPTCVGALSFWRWT